MLTSGFPEITSVRLTEAEAKALIKNFKGKDDIPLPSDPNGHDDLPLGPVVLIFRPVATNHPSYSNVLAAHPYCVWSHTPAALPGACLLVLAATIN